MDKDRFAMKQTDRTFSQTQEHVFQDKKIQFINSSSGKSFQNYRQFQKMIIENQASQESSQKIIPLSALEANNTPFLKTYSKNNHYGKMLFVKECRNKHHFNKYLQEFQQIQVPKKSKEQIQKRNALSKRSQMRKIDKKQKIKQIIVERIHFQQFKEQEQRKQEENLSSKQEKLKTFIQRQQFYQKQRKILSEMRQFCIYGAIRRKQNGKQ